MCDSMEDQEIHRQSQRLHNEHIETSGHVRPRRTLVAKAKQKFMPGIKLGLLLAIAVYLILIVIGGYGIKKCPVEDNIPLFLIATGAIGLISKSLSYIRDHVALHLDVKYIETALYSVEIVFFILGAYWVYKIYPPKYESKNGEAYCDRTVYMFAFVYLTIVFTIVAAILSGFAFFLICICFLKTIEESDDTADPEAQTNNETPETRQPTV